jgi:hypothetical protein
MSLSIAHLDANPEPQDGEEIIALLVTVAQPQKRGDAEGWRARARCEETGRVIGRWMGDCPLSVVQSALLWLSLHPWEVVSDEEGMDYGEILEKVERPISNDQIHVRDLLDRIATNLPGRPSEIRNSVTGARIRRRTLALTGPAAVAEDDTDDDANDVDDVDGAEGDDVEDVEPEVEEVRPSRRGTMEARAEQAERNRLLQKALALAQAGRDVDGLAQSLERRMDADLAETFRVAYLAVHPPAPEPRAKPGRSALASSPEMSVEAEDEIARYAVGDESGVRAKLDRTAARAVRERARVEAALAANARQAARRETLGPVRPAVAPAPAVAPPAVPAAPAVVPAAPVAVAAPVVAPAAVKPKSRRKPGLSVVEPAAAG